MRQEPSNTPAENTETIATAEQKILEIRQNVYTMGANDSEFSQLNYILMQLNAGKITPEKAVAEAGKIQDSKMDYH